MSFVDEIVKLRLRIRTFLRLSDADNPESPLCYGDRRYGRTPDNTGEVPVLGTANSLGTFSETLACMDRALEVPQITTELADPDREWRTLASTPSNLINRWVTYVIRVIDRYGVAYDEDIAVGQINNVSFPPGGSVSLDVKMLPGYFAEKVPKTIITKADWPNAIEDVLGRAAPIIYGKQDNSLGLVDDVDAEVQEDLPAVEGFAGVLQTGGQGQNKTTVYYAISQMKDRMFSPPTIIGPFTTTASQRKVLLSWTPPSGSPDGIAIWRSITSDFSSSIDRYRSGTHTEFSEAANPTAEEAAVNLPGGSSSLLDLYPHKNSTTFPAPDPHWDIWQPRTLEYFVSAVFGENESARTGPATVVMTTAYPRSVLVTWTGVIGATGYAIRRRRKIGKGSFGGTGQWFVSTETPLAFIDQNLVTTPSDFPTTTGSTGALPVLHVNTNPKGKSFGQEYLVARHACKRIVSVHVLKEVVQENGGRMEELTPPDGLKATVVGTPGTTWYFYMVTARRDPTELNKGRYETGRVSANVLVRNAPNTLNNTNKVVLTWNPVDDRDAYVIYRAEVNEDYKALAATLATTYTDNGRDQADGAHPNHFNTTGKAFREQREHNAPQQWVLQTPNSDYRTEVRVVNGITYQLIKFSRNLEGADVSVNVWGIEDAGDGSGTLIEQAGDVAYHFLLNWIFNDYKTGAWFTDTSYRPGLLNKDSFDAVTAGGWLRLPESGYLAAGAVLDQADSRQVIQEMLTSLDLSLALRSGQWFLDFYTPTTADRNAVPQFTPNETTFKETFNSSFDTSRLATTLPFNAGPIYGPQQAQRVRDKRPVEFGAFILSGEIVSTLAASEFFTPYIAEPMVLLWTRHAPTVADVVTRRARYVRNPILMASHEVSPAGVIYPVGTLVAVTHPEGVSADPEGWVRRVCRVVARDIDFNTGTVTQTLEDVDIFAGGLSMADPIFTYDFATVVLSPLEVFETEDFGVLDETEVLV